MVKDILTPTSAPVAELADSLEEHVNDPRASFDHLPAEDRHRIAHTLITARTQTLGADWSGVSAEFRWHLQQKKYRLLHICGDLGIGVQTALRLWWGYVYDETAPAPRDDRYPKV